MLKGMSGLDDMIQRSSSTADDAPHYQCFKCKQDKPIRQFLYTHLAETEEDLQRCVEGGTAWACEQCFLRSKFCKTVFQVAEVEEENGEGGSSASWFSDPFLTVCMHCRVAKPAWKFACYGRWFETEEGTAWNMSTTALRSFIDQRFLRWGCNDCFATHPVSAYKSALTGKWRSICAPTSRGGKYREKMEPCRGRVLRKKRKFKFTMKKVLPASWKKQGK
jgi:hypothetical protein